MSCWSAETPHLGGAKYQPAYPFLLLGPEIVPRVRFDEFELDENGGAVERGRPPGRARATIRIVEGTAPARPGDLVGRDELRHRYGRPTRL